MQILSYVFTPLEKASERKMKVASLGSVLGNRFLSKMRDQFLENELSSFCQVREYDGIFTLFDLISAHFPISAQYDNV